MGRKVRGWVTALLLLQTACSAPVNRENSAPPPAKTKFNPRKLTVCSVAGIGGGQPVFKHLQHEGDVAWFGLELLASGDPDIAAYLMSKERDGGWEYQDGYGPTGLDTTLVLEGLMHAGIPEAVIARLADRLVKRFYRRTEGYFVTLDGGKADYWRGPDVEVNAHAGYLLLQGAPGLYAAEISAAARYVAAAQRSDGGWDDKWFPSRTIATFYATRLLKPLGAAYTVHVTKAADYLRLAQRSDGSWGGSAIDTAAALLALRAAGFRGHSVNAGEAWLTAWLQTPKRPAEPVLHYWTGTGDAREYYACFDDGTIASAWVTLALHGPAGKGVSSAPAAKHRFD